MAREFAIDRARFKREMKRRGIKNSAELARNIGVAKTTAWRVLNGEAAPGPNFVYSVLDAWQLEFHDVFKSAKPARRLVAA